MLRSLSDERMLRFRENDRTYSIGPLAHELGLAAMPDVQVEEEWRPVVHQVAQQTRLTSYLMARSGNDAVCLVCAQGTAAIRAMPIEVGQRVPLGIGAGSLAILAALDDSEIDRITGENAKSLALFPGGKPDGLRDRIDQARRLGYSVSSGTMAHGLTGVGVLVPVRNRSSQLAITVSAVAPTVPAAEAASLASAISKAMQQHASIRP
jgi:DNA-binding IclR family transcriptional regulator